MKLYMFDDSRLGVAAEDGTLVDITATVPADVPALDRMTALIEAWDDVRDEVAAAASAGGGVAFEDVTLRAPQPRPHNLVAAPVNYHAHQGEMGGENGVYKGMVIPTIEEAKGFFKSISSIVGPDGRIELPLAGRRFDHEAEVAVIIGRTARRVAEEDALSYVFGYAPVMDITLRGPEDRSFRKSMDTFTPLGPCIVTADEVADPTDIDFRLTVGEEERQASNTSYLIYGVARLIAEYSAVTTLHPGDVIATGTPEGVGPITDGDVVTLEIAGMDPLVMNVVDVSA